MTRITYVSRTYIVKFKKGYGKDGYTTATHVNRRSLDLNLSKGYGVWLTDVRNLKSVYLDPRWD